MNMLPERRRYSMTLKQEIQELLDRAEKIKHEEYQIVTGYAHDEDSKTSKWLNDVLLLSRHLPVDNPLKFQIEETYKLRRVDKKYPQMCSILRSLLDDKTLEENIMNQFQQVSAEAENALNEIIEHETDENYWPKRFNDMQRREQTIIRGLFGELQKNGLISVLYGCGLPTEIIVNADGYLYEQRKKQIIKPNPQPANASLQQLHKKYDVFLSHANEDKLSYVDELYSIFTALGIRIFYDKAVLEWGDNWKKRILSGTAPSEFAVIVISNNFFGREWTEKELNEFLQRQNETGEKIILPLLYDISIEDLKSHYPQLEDIQAIKSSDKSKEEIAILLAGQLIKRYKGVE